MKLIRVNNLFSKLLKRLFFFIAGTFIILISLFEIPLFLIRNKKIFSNNVLLPFWHWSFGHQVLGYDWVSKLYHPNRVSVIMIPNFRNNLYLNYCYDQNLDFFVFKSQFFSEKTKPGKIRFVILRGILLLISIINNNFSVIDHMNSYRTLALAKNLRRYDEKTKIIEGFNSSGYINLINLKKNLKPELRNKLYEKCKKSIENIYPNFFSKPFICLLLRQARSKEYFDSLRVCKQENYILSVKYLANKGYNVVGCGETSCSIFSSINGFFDFSMLDINSSLLNIFLLTNCSHYISQHSGAYILPNLVGVPVTLTDSFPFNVGTYNSNDVILFKNVEFKNKILTIDEILKSHKHLIYGKGFDEENYRLIENSEIQILNAIKKNGLKKIEFPPDTLIHYQKNFICVN